MGLNAQVNMTPTRIFHLYLNNIQQSCFLTKQRYDASLWNFRFGHLNFVVLKTLQQNNMVIDLPQISAPSEIR